MLAIANTFSPLLGTCWRIAATIHKLLQQSETKFIARNEMTMQSIKSTHFFLRMRKKRTDSKQKLH